MSAYTIDVATIATITKAAGLLLIPDANSLVCPAKGAQRSGPFRIAARCTLESC